MSGNLRIVEALYDPSVDTNVLCPCGCGRRIGNPMHQCEDGTWIIMPITQEDLDRIKAKVDSGEVKH